MIVVIAQKREQSWQNVPIAVTAISSDALEANRVTDVTNLVGLAPGVTIRTSAGGSKLPAFQICGANSFGVVPGSDKQVSIYIDGVYISSPRGSIFDLSEYRVYRDSARPTGHSLRPKCNGGSRERLYPRSDGRCRFYRHAQARRSGAGHGRHDGATEERDPSHRRQADAQSDH